MTTLNPSGGSASARAALNEGTTMTDFPLDPTRAALINVDMQRCFVKGSPLASPQGLELVQRINQLSAQSAAPQESAWFTQGAGCGPTAPISA